MRIYNTKVYGLEESILRSAYPMSVKVGNMSYWFDKLQGIEAKDKARATTLGRAKQGSGHDCYLKGIIVQADFEAPQYWWMQAERYHWFDIVSSQSKMHRITEMNIEDQCNEYVYPEVLKKVQVAINKYKKETDPTEKKQLFYEIVSNCPMGLNLTAGVSTNYLQLKTMYLQRKGHKMDDWSIDFINWCNELPSFTRLCMKEE